MNRRESPGGSGALTLFLFCGMSDTEFLLSEGVESISLSGNFKWDSVLSKNLKGKLWR